MTDSGEAGRVHRLDQLPTAYDSAETGDDAIEPIDRLDPAHDLKPTD